MPRTPKPSVVGPSPIDALATIHRTRLRVALNGLVLALEAAAYEGSGSSAFDGSAWTALARKVPERVDACRALLRAVGPPRDDDDLATLSAMRESIEALVRVYDAFVRDGDREAAERLLGSVATVKARLASLED